MYTYEIFKTNNEGYGFKILFCGTPIINQEYKPDVDGFQDMSEEESLFYVNEILHRLEGTE